MLCLALEALTGCSRCAKVDPEVRSGIPRSSPNHTRLQERTFQGVTFYILAMLCRTSLSRHRTSLHQERVSSSKRTRQAHRTGIRIRRRTISSLRRRASCRRKIPHAVRPAMDAGALILGILRRLRPARRSPQSLSEKVCALVSSLTGTMMFLFVLMIHLPNAIAHPKERLFWTLVSRETAFAGGALALAGFAMQQDNLRRSRILIFLARLCVAIPLIFFGGPTPSVSCVRARCSPRKIDSGLGSVSLLLGLSHWGCTAHCRSSHSSQ